MGVTKPQTLGELERFIQWKLPPTNEREVLLRGAELLLEEYTPATPFIQQIKDRLFHVCVDGSGCEMGPSYDTVEEVEGSLWLTCEEPLASRNLIYGIIRYLL
mgnify:CR=1 FL=1